MQRSRRTNPHPFTWEVPVAGTAVLVVALVLGAQAGRSVANLLAGNGWAFVRREDLFSTLGGVLQGDPSAGLSGIATPAGPTLLWVCVGLVELLVLLACGAAATWALGRWGPGRLKGMATPAQAEALLGRTRLHRQAKVIRPDLYGGTRRDPR
ncbi:hypothetical protein LG324_03420 [Phycicoccus jejuensis]|uniref:hypothetical protein n=1 Tax=Phycicoccus jejuensis TaxID=367299 RepID=UPI00384AC5CF